MRSMRGMPLVSKLNSRIGRCSSSRFDRDEASSGMPRKIPASKDTSYSKDLNTSCSGNPQPQRRIDSSNPIIGHDSQAAGEGFGLPRGKRFPDIEDTKKYKAQDQTFPVQQREWREVGDHL